MDHQERVRQARKLRNKRLAKRTTSNPVTVKKGVVKTENPSPQPKEKSNLAPPSKAEIRRQRAQKILKQRLALSAVNRKAALKKRAAGGCGKCGRKLGNK